MSEYNFKEIETKHQKRWGAENYGKSEDFSDKPKHYHLVEFPYPSGAGLHVGHCMGYGASDAYCRMKRMQGFNVMYPMGWDAFGLPTENFAIKNKIKPQKATADNVAVFKTQMKSLGLSFDWDREINTTDPDYYRWTQWIFLQFYKHAIVRKNSDDSSSMSERQDFHLVEVADDDHHTPRLAYQAEMPVNWCSSCKTNLANEEVISGACERCGTQTEKKMQKQWMLRITAYADRLIDDLASVDYLEKIKTQQINWIGRSEGANIIFDVKGYSNTVHDEEIEVFTTRADTLFGCTYVVLAPEHPLVKKLGHHIQNFEEVSEYIENAKKKSDLERTELQKDKTGVKLYGVFAINPINKEHVDIYVADYVLASYGTGAVMAVPAHDQRDYEFAKKHEVHIKQVIAPLFETTSGPDAIRDDLEFVERDGVAVWVKHWSEDKYLMLDWEKFGWKTPILGGIESGETQEDAAAREVKEETGYQNIKSIEKIGFEAHAKFFARHKNVNRLARFNAFVATLENDQFRQPSIEETKNHKTVWIDGNDIGSFINLPKHKFFWDAYTNGDKAFEEYGILINSNDFDGLTSSEAKKLITTKLNEIGRGKASINFKLRDWIFSRQHYWGEPIPIVHCERCGMVPLTEDQLPLTLPDVENYEPTNTGESPLAAITDWVETVCPKCDGKAKRETDTMPNWAGSSWYYLAYAAQVESRKSKVESKNIFIDRKDQLDYWMPVDIYNGGMEHTTLHLLYSRFWHKFLFDLGAAHTSEPYAKRIAHGIILGPDGRKMSKSFGNVINPDEIVKQFGADTLRMYIAFIGPYDQESAWNMAGVQGVSRFLKRVWNNVEKISDKPDSKELLIKLNQTISGLSGDLQNFRLNTAVAKLMEFNNTLEKVGAISKVSFCKFVQLLYPLAPHIASEIWELAANNDPIEKSEWPAVESKYLIAETIEIVVQINGKVRERISVSSNISDDELKKSALESSKIKEIIDSKEIVKVIVIPKKLVSIVIK